MPGNVANHPLPETPVEVAASLRATPTEVLVAGRWVTVPAMLAVDWLELLTGDLDLELIFPGLLSDDDADWVEDALVEGEISIQDMQRLAIAVITEVSGRPWWIACKLVISAQSKWSIIGADLAAKQIDATRIPLGLWLDSVWRIIFDRTANEKWPSVAAQLEAPPPGFENEVDLDMTTDDFAALMNE